MRYLNIACYCVDFENYEFLQEILQRTAFAKTGAELSMFSDRPDYMERLLAQRKRFASCPVTFHGPYMEVEATAAPGSGQYRQIKEAYEMAFDVYEKFEARSIVMHTNQRKIVPDSKEILQKNAVGHADHAIHRTDRQVQKSGVDKSFSSHGIGNHSCTPAHKRIDNKNPKQINSRILHNVSPDLFFLVFFIITEK